MLKRSASRATFLLTGERSRNRISITGTSQSCITTSTAIPSRHSSGDHRDVVCRGSSVIGHDELIACQQWTDDPGDDDDGIQRTADAGVTNRPHRGSLTGLPGPEVAQNGQRSARQSNHGRNQRRGCFVAVPHDLIELVGCVCIFRCRMTR